MLHGARGAATLSWCCLRSMLVHALDYPTRSTMGSDEPGRVGAHAHRNSTEGACSSPRLARLHDRRRADEKAFASPLHSGTAVEGRCSSCFRTLLERAPHGRPPGAVSRGGRICVRSAGTREARTAVYMVIAKLGSDPSVHPQFAGARGKMRSAITTRRQNTFRPEQFI